MARQPLFIGISIAILVILFFLKISAYTVSETEQVVVTQLGKPVRIVGGREKIAPKDTSIPWSPSPGLYFRIPFLQQLHYFDDRVLDYDSAPAPIITKDKKTLEMDNYAKWRIVDPLVFLMSVQNEQNAQARLDDIIYSKLREQLGLHTLTEIVAKARGKLMGEVTKTSNAVAQQYGIEIIDVRIKRADLPPENAKAVFGRMRAEREREARRYRSEGKEEALKIRAETDKLRSILLAEAYEKEQTIRGEGDAEATRIYAEAYQQDPQFFVFLRTLEAYKKSLRGKTTLLLPPQSEFLQFLTR
ncbi:MAG: protease modulator HflC [Nitrospinota bacterium]|nr:MAG: protease modulator HflC [Nitrospinota bacterium]